VGAEYVAIADGALRRTHYWCFVVLRPAGSPRDYARNVHVFGPGWVVVINLIEVEVREVIACDEREARRVLRLVAGHQGALMDAWRRFHG
jgi:hypothetical protein